MRYVLGSGGEHRDPLEKRNHQVLRRSIIAETLGNLTFFFAAGLVVWLWLGADLRFVSRLALTSTVAFGLGVWRSLLRAPCPDPRQDPAGRALGVVYPLLFWTAVSIGFALWAAAWAVTH